MRSWIPLAQTAPSIGPTSPAPEGGGAAAPVAAPVTGAAASQPGVAPKQDTPSIFTTLILPLGAMLAALYFFMYRGQNKDSKKRKSMIEQMKRGDEVMTIGGLVAKIVEVKEDRVILKIDESANVKATYLKTAIQTVVNEDTEDAKAKG